MDFSIPGLVHDGDKTDAGLMRLHGGRGLFNVRIPKLDGSVEAAGDDEIPLARVVEADEALARVKHHVPVARQAFHVPRRALVDLVRQFAQMHRVLVGVRAGDEALHPLRHLEKHHLTHPVTVQLGVVRIVVFKKWVVSRVLSLFQRPNICQA